MWFANLWEVQVSMRKLLDVATPVVGKTEVGDTTF